MGEVRLDDAKGTASSPVIRADSCGDAVVAFLVALPMQISDVVASTYVPATGWSMPAQIDVAGTASEVELALTPDGTAAAVFTEGNGTSVSLNYFTGGQWGQPFQIAVPASGTTQVTAPSVSLTPTGTPAVIYNSLDPTNTASGQILVATFL
jgi:hypothetical protein